MIEVIRKYNKKYMINIHTLFPQMLWWIHAANQDLQRIFNKQIFFTPHSCPNLIDIQCRYTYVYTNVDMRKLIMKRIQVGNYFYQYNCKIFLHYLCLLQRLIYYVNYPLI